MKKMKMKKMMTMMRMRRIEILLLAQLLPWNGETNSFLPMHFKEEQAMVAMADCWDEEREGLSVSLQGIAGGRRIVKLPD